MSGWKMRLSVGVGLAVVAALGRVAIAQEKGASQTQAAVGFVAFGDWGFDTDDRTTVAETMAKYAGLLGAKGERFSAAFLLGDNFRVKLADTKDPYIQKLFEKTYDSGKLNIPFYAALGNHDYEEDKAAIELAYAKEHPESRWKMPAKWYRVELPSKEEPIVTVLVLDSDQQALSKGEWAEEKAWIGEQLKTKRAAWTVCCAHHTMFSNGNHGDNGVLQVEWGEMFKKGGVDIYMCGHDHTLQHLEIKDWPVSFVVAGGGGAGRKPMLQDARGPFSKSEMGFAHMSFTKEKATVTLVNGVTGEGEHVFERDRAGVVTVTKNSASDKATGKKLKVIQGLPEGGGTTKPATDE